MTPFYVMFFITIVLGLKLDKTEKSRRFFCVITAILYFLLAALRSSQVGVDTADYVRMFQRVGSWREAITVSNSNKDPFFGGFLFIIKSICFDYTFLFIIVAGWFTWNVWRFIYKYSRDPLLSVILLLAFNLYQFSLTGMRQTLAMGFIVLACDLIINKKYKTATAVLLLAALFHKSALLALILLPISFFKKEMNKTRAAFLAFSMLFVFGARSYIARLLILLIQDRDYAIQNDNSGTVMLLVFVVLFSMIVLFINHTSSIEEHSGYFMYIAAIALFFEIFVPVQAVFFRLAFYFLFAFVILVPNTIETQNDYKTRLIMKMVIYILMSVQYLFFTIGSSGVVPYTFFWNI